MKHVFFIHERKRFVLEEDGDAVRIYKEVVTRKYKESLEESEYDETWHRSPYDDHELKVAADDLPILMEGIGKFLNRKSMI